MSAIEPDEAPILSPAKQVLLRALDNIEQAEEEFDAPCRYLVVLWAIDSPEHGTVRGWDATDQPPFVTTGLLREVAAKIEGQSIVTDEDDDA